MVSFNNDFMYKNKVDRAVVALSLDSLCVSHGADKYLFRNRMTTE